MTGGSSSGEQLGTGILQRAGEGSALTSSGRLPPTSHPGDPSTPPPISLQEQYQTNGPGLEQRREWGVAELPTSPISDCGYDSGESGEARDIRVELELALSTDSHRRPPVYESK